MKYIGLFLCALILSCSSKQEDLTAEKIIEKSIQFHDVNNQWKEANFTFHIQEPRVGNPKRFSVVTLNNKENSFVLQRNRDEHISTHTINEKGEAFTTLNGKIITDSTLIKKYRLEPKRNANYHRFYETLLGLPMSLATEEKEIKSAIKTTFNDKMVFKVEIELKEPLFSKNWNVYFSQENYKIVGLEMVFPDNPEKGERLVFEDELKYKNIIIPRIRHWRELNNEYSGSDIIVSKTDID